MMVVVVHVFGICSVCNISDGYTTEDLVFIWKDEKPLSIKENLELPEFGIAGIDVGDCTRVFSTGTNYPRPAFYVFSVCVLSSFFPYKTKTK